jgi:GntR family transcriptional repressor for pyruvate dehydrogenase complex
MRRMGRLHREVMQALIEDIVSGRRAAGEMLPREIDLATAFDVSRGVARECLRAMEERGLVSVRHGRGATVRPAEDWDVLDPGILAAILGGDGGNDLLAEYVECRRVIEVAAAGLAAERATPDRLGPAADALARMEESAGRDGRAAEERFHESDVAFHQAVIRAGGNRPLADLARRIHAGLLVARYPLARPEYRQTRALPEHRRIYDAVAAGDAAEARHAMNDHLDTVAGYVMERAGGTLAVGR